MSEILVIGHRNPDTDSICSALAYADYKRRIGMSDAVAARCGDINDRIGFVLNTFGVAPPRFVADVSPKVRDVMQQSVVSVLPEATVAEALGIMDERDIRVLPILNADQTCRGLVSVFKMSKFFLPAPNRLFDSRRVLTSIDNLARVLKATVLHARDPEVEEDLILMIGAMRFESFFERLATYPRQKMLVVVGDRRDIQELAIREGVRAIIVTGGLVVEPDIIEAARARQVSMLLSPHDSATTAMLCRAAISVEHMIHENFLSFREDELLGDVETQAVTSHFHAFPVIDHQQRTVGILSKSDFLKKVDRRLILVDHNELAQAVRGADKVEILEIIDHHRLGPMSTPQPILFRNEPVGSTCTIVAECFLREHIELTRPMAGLLLAGLVSDTLNLTSPTTTPRDARVLERLEQLSGVRATEFTEKMFASGSVLISKPASQAITTDCKEYTERGLRFSVAQIEEIGFEQFTKRKGEVLAALEKYRAKKDYFFSSLLVTDVVNQTSMLVLTGSDSFKAQINYPELESGLYELNGVVSRKKQLLPYLIHCLEQMK